MTAAKPKPIASLTAEEMSAEIREIQWRLEKYYPTELPATTHARRVASLKRFRAEDEARLSQLVTELGSKVQEEQRIREIEHKPGFGILDLPRHEASGAITREWMVGHAAPEHARRVEISRVQQYPQVAHPGPAWHWLYVYTADGGPRREYGRGLTDTRRYLARTFPNASIVETWKN